MCKHVAPPPESSVRRKTLGTIMNAWVAYVNALRGKFKFGITKHPVTRSCAKWPDGSTYRTQYHRGNMVVLGMFETGEAAGAAEAFFIYLYKVLNPTPLCQNVAKGDDGRQSSSKFLYVMVEEGNVATW